MAAPHDAYILQKLITTGYVRLTSTHVIVHDCTIQAVSANAGNVSFKDNAGNIVEWVPGEWYVFRCVDLNSLQVLGTAQDHVTIIGVRS